MTLLTLEARLQGQTLPQFVRRAVMVQWGASAGPAVMRAIDSAGIHETVRAAARVNAGRWIVDCPIPGCHSAQIAHRSDPRYFCCDCLNGGVGHEWVRVTWPPDADRIEEILLLRPVPGTRNWTPGETLEELVAENRAHGVAVP